MNTIGGLHAHYETSSTQSVVLEAAARTHVGVVRKANEDSMIAERPIFLVADGMGGHEAGDLASAAAIDAFRALVGTTLQLRPADVDAAIEVARAAVLEIAGHTERGAGCTLTGVVLVEHLNEPCWYVVNIGDSRVYEHTGASLMQLTNDHSLRAELQAAGSANAAKAPRNVITRALGSEDSRHDAWLIPVTTGSRLLLCSDGLTTEVSDEEIRAVLTVGGRPDAVADELVRRACEAGGRDNVTVVIVDTVAGAAEHDDDHEDFGSTMDATIEITRPVRR
ncbi:protein phosphatase [Leucobacter exalbidus]|uniref:Protein phosphatase n=1 Tax=Leucobacter exalbidus TaxID=662960 RepID=A0A940T5L4_9MICO|nr:protein phosphatase 2C domain-containing protein [Leucobacter exalbidus]MBP1326116.1 protein phosphatase [Leucobacter exalbidus]